MKTFNLYLIDAKNLKQHYYLSDKTVNTWEWDDGAWGNSIITTGYELPDNDPYASHILRQQKDRDIDNYVLLEQIELSPQETLLLRSTGGSLSALASNEGEQASFSLLAKISNVTLLTFLKEQMLPAKKEAFEQFKANYDLQCEQEDFFNGLSDSEKAVHEALQQSAVTGLRARLRYPASFNSLFQKALMKSHAWTVNLFGAEYYKDTQLVQQLPYRLKTRLTAYISTACPAQNIDEAIAWYEQAIDLPHLAMRKHPLFDSLRARVKGRMDYTASQKRLLSATLDVIDTLLLQSDEQIDAATVTQSRLINDASQYFPDRAARINETVLSPTIQYGEEDDTTQVMPQQGETASRYTPGFR